MCRWLVWLDVAGRVGSPLGEGTAVWLAVGFGVGAAGTGCGVKEVGMSTIPTPQGPVPGIADPDPSAPDRPDDDPDLTPDPVPEPDPDEDPDEQLPRDI